MQAYVNLRNRESAIWTLTRDVQVLAIGTVMFTLSNFVDYLDTDVYDFGYLPTQRKFF